VPFSGRIFEDRRETAISTTRNISSIARGGRYSYNGTSLQVKLKIAGRNEKNRVLYTRT